jgi:antitoxin component of MazEF toxin-antitoxin module
MRFLDIYLADYHLAMIDQLQTDRSSSSSCYKFTVILPRYTRYIGRNFYIDTGLDYRCLSNFVALVKWGNSVRLVLPKPIRDGMKLKAGDKTRVDDNRIYVVCVPKKDRLRFSRGRLCIGLCGSNSNSNAA